MWIDLLFLLFMLLAVFRGLRHGLILSVLSAVAWVAGLAAAIKLSATVALLLRNSMHLSTRWLPVLAFVLVFLAVVLLIRWGAKLAEAGLDLAMMGWLNKSGGVLLYAALYTVVLSVLLFYALQVHVVSRGYRNVFDRLSIHQIMGTGRYRRIGQMHPLFQRHVRATGNIFRTSAAGPFLK